ncbi:MAG: HAD family hydrolase [Holophagaceae bacterium]|nr:HAD family hydrolase [Holophagaceae bacterium]
MSPHRPILEALERLKSRPASAPRPIAVYDLDSTLFCTGPRNLAIARAFSEYRHQLRPFVDRLEAHRMGWNVMTDLQELGFADQVILTELRHFWRATFFTDHFVKMDSVYPGAVELVQALREAGCLTFYLTGRDDPGMRQGTLQALSAAGFPMPAEDVVLRLKPTWEEDDLAFKTKVFDELNALGDVALAFENEPTNANRFLRAFPAATVVLHATIHSPDPEPLDPGVHVLKTLAADWIQSSDLQ